MGRGGGGRPADSSLDLFWDSDAGVFFTTGADAEGLVARPVDTQDGALPSANSVAASSPSASPRSPGRAGTRRRRRRSSMR